MNRKHFFGLAALFFILLSACTSSGNKSNNATSYDTIAKGPAINSVDSMEAEAELDKLALLKEFTTSKGFVCAASYIGTILDGSTETDFIANSPYKTGYPFMTQIENERIVRNNGNELYCIVPAKGFNNITVSSFIVDESNDYKGAADKELYSASDGKPILVRGNISEIMPNVIVTLSNGEDVFSFNPSLSMRDGSLNRYNIKDKVSDFTIYPADMVFEED